MILRLKCSSDNGVTWTACPYGDSTTCAAGHGHSGRDRRHRARCDVYDAPCVAQQTCQAEGACCAGDAP